MKRSTIALALAALLAGSSVHAQDAGKAPAAKAAPGPVEAGAPMPAGHPPVAGEGAEDPHAGADPHAGGAGAGARGGGPGGGGGPGEQAPEDGAMEDPTLPKGSIEIHIADAQGAPLPKTDVTLGIIYNSVAKGESRKRVTAVTDELGKARFADLDSGSGVAYRVMVLKDDATFSATPFQLGPRSGMRVLLHVYPVTRDIAETLVVTQSMLYAEVKDDRVQIQQAFKIYNFGRNAWVPPADFVVPLPPEFTAFATQQGMTDVGVDAIPKKGVKLRGTFSPGQHVVEFKWQVPYGGEAEVKLDVGMTPNLAAARVIAPAARNMTLDVEGFDAPRSSTDGMGQRALVAEKQVRRDEPAVKSVKLALRGLPTEGPGKVIATFLALCGVVAGVVLGTKKAPPRDHKGERARLLEALSALEQGHRDGTIGPKTYERARRELIDDIARTFADDKPATKPSGAKPKRTARPAV